MFNKDILKLLPEFQNVEVSQPNFGVIDDMPDPSIFVEDNDLINQIFTVNPKTGFPFNDLDILDSAKTSNEVRDYLLRSLRSIPKFNNPDLTDEDLINMTYSRFENSSDYVKRLESYFEEGSSSD